LYKINEDQTEIYDLAKQCPEIVKRLSERWKELADTHQVFPKPKK
jgi:arylsulfatase